MEDDQDIDASLGFTDEEAPPRLSETTGGSSDSPCTSSSEDESTRRRSSRVKSSTLVYIDGHAVKKLNNYVVTADQYIYNNNNDDSNDGPPPKKKTLKSEPRKKPPHPRTVSPEEAARRVKKQQMEAAQKEKEPFRNYFLQSNLPILRPFMDEKSIAKIQTTTDTQALPTETQVRPPKAITATLRDYQLEGLVWMSQMYRQNMGTILGDEMGLGKTLQTISLICHLKETQGMSGPSLIVCPLSVLYSWSNEIKKWAPSLQSIRWHSSNPESMDIPDLSSYDIVVTTYEMTKVGSLKHYWSRQPFNLLVLDEGHRIKNKETQISDAVRKIHCENRLILTGTPLANNLVELFSLLNFLAGDVFTVEDPWRDAFDIANNVVDNEKLEQAHKILQLFMLRRLKSEVEKLMPKKIETKIVCPLSNTQIWWYKAILLKDINLLARGSSASDKAKRLSNLIMQLRKCCLHPYLFPDAEDIENTTLQDLVADSGKLAVLDKLLCSLYEKGHRVCLFSQFTSVLDILDDYSRMRGWKYCRLDGGTPRAERNYVVNHFNAPNSSKFLFLMSTRSGGMGLNLQTADTCVLFDSDWNPQPDIQAMARVHRIGQTKTVHVYRLVTEGTVEARMIERAEKKLFLETVVARNHKQTELEENDTEKLMSTLKFGCHAVFGEDSNKYNTLPTDEDIALITDRTRTEAFSNGKLKGGTDSNAKEFLATKELTATTNFSGIDFGKIREQYNDAKTKKTMSDLSSSWRKKRERKQRIKLIESKNSGWGSAAVPVLAANDYDLATGERSVFQQELKGQGATAEKKKKNEPTFISQDYCQVCWDGGDLICCPRCPVTLHLECIGLQSTKNFLHCSHHHCSVCDKSATLCGGFLFPCNACPRSYCEDHLPETAEFIETNERIEKLDFQLKHGVYVHCSDKCKRFAIDELDYKEPHDMKDPTPPPLDVAASFGGAIDESLNAPDDVTVTGKRRRNVVDYAQANTGKKPSATASGNGHPMTAADFSKKKAKTCPSIKPASLLSTSLPDNRSKSKERHGSPRVTDLSLDTDSKGGDSPRYNRVSNTEVQFLKALDAAQLTPTKKAPPTSSSTPVQASATGASQISAALANVYDVSVPIGEYGLLAWFDSDEFGRTIIRGYRRDPFGRPGEAERQNLFRLRDQVVAVDGVSVEGLLFPEVCKRLGDFSNKSVKKIRMRRESVNPANTRPKGSQSAKMPPSENPSLKRKSSSPTDRPPSWEGPPEDYLEGGKSWPDGWWKKVYVRTGSSHRDRYWFTPQEQIKLRSLVAVNRFMKALEKCNGKEHMALQTMHK